MAQCSELTLVTPNANRLYQNGVEMNVGRQAAQCSEAASISYVIAGKAYQYCESHGERRREWVKEMQALGR